MSVAAFLIPGLDEIVRQGDPGRLADAVRRIAELLVRGAATFQPDHVELFDRVLIDLVPHTGIAAAPISPGAERMLDYWKGRP